MNSPSDYQPDLDRFHRIGIDEAILCEFKSIDQIERIIRIAAETDESHLLTRLSPEQFSALDSSIQKKIDYEAESHTGIVGEYSEPYIIDQVAILTGGTSDLKVAREAVRTLNYHGIGSSEYHDVGVAGLWRVLEIEGELFSYSVVIVVAGMDAALPTVVAGLIPASIIAVPSSVGYGVSEGGRSALETILSSCAPGVVTVNIDNGYGAACAAIRILNQLDVFHVASFDEEY